MIYQNFSMAIIPHLPQVKSPLKTKEMLSRRTAQTLTTKSLKLAGYALGGMISLYGLSGCASSLNQETASFEAGADIASEVDLAASPTAQATAAKVTSEPSPSPVPNSRPQLIKRANLTLTVGSVDEGLEAVSNIIQRQQGDILDLRDTQPESGQRRLAYLRIRVPQTNLEATLNALSEVGTPQQRSITAEDVSTQLVDLQARLRNLQKSEEALLKIMDRSGSIADVLEVSRELSTVRQQVEQISAQLENLQAQVSYSTIELSLEAAGTNLTVTRPLGEKVGGTWKQASQSVSQFTVGLLQMGLWLLAYSPYLAVVGVGAVIGHRWRRSRSLISKGESGRG